MGGCASKPKELDTTRPEALPSESTSPKKADIHDDKGNTTTATTTTTTASREEEAKEPAPLVDLSSPKEEEREASEEAAPAVVPAQVPAAAAEAEVVATEKPKEATKVDDQVEVAAKQLAEINILEAVEETKQEAQEIKPEAKEEKPAAAASPVVEIIKPKAKEEEVVLEQPKAAAGPRSEEKTKDEPKPIV